MLLTSFQSTNANVLDLSDSVIVHIVEAFLNFPDSLCLSVEISIESSSKTTQSNPKVCNLSCKTPTGLRDQIKISWFEYRECLVYSDFSLSDVLPVNEMWCHLSVYLIVLSYCVIQTIEIIWLRRWHSSLPQWWILQFSKEKHSPCGNCWKPTQEIQVGVKRLTASNLLAKIIVNNKISIIVYYPFLVFKKIFVHSVLRQFGMIWISFVVRVSWISLQK